MKGQTKLPLFLDACHIDKAEDAGVVVSRLRSSRQAAKVLDLKLVDVLALSDLVRAITGLLICDVVENRAQHTIVIDEQVRVAL